MSAPELQRLSSVEDASPTTDFMDDDALYDDDTAAEPAEDRVAWLRPYLVRGGWVGLVLLLLAGFAWMSAGASSARYLTAPVTLGALQATVNATGTLRPTQTVEIGPRVSGRIESIDVDFNSLVMSGQVIARIDAATYRVQVRQAEASLATAQAALRRSEGDLNLREQQLDRSRRLLSQKVIPREQFEAARNAFVQAEAQVAMDRAGIEVAEAGLEDARVNLAYTDIVSPVDGVVLSRNVNVGQTVAASFQTPTLFVIANDLTRMQLEVSVSEADIGAVREEQRARFSVDTFPGRIFDGRVAQVRNAARNVQNVVTYDVVVAVANPERLLRPGMTANVTIVTSERKNALKIPARALRFRPSAELLASAGPQPEDRGDARLWLARGAGSPQPIAVTLGISGDDEVEVRGGDLTTGDRVVIGYDRGADGGR